MSKGTFYITTPIYYPSGKLHIGNAYCSIAADAMARYKKLDGYEVYFITGTDEHGQKIEQRAAEANKTPIAFVDEIVAGIKDLWQLLHIEYDDYIRTTEPRHIKVVQQFYQKLYDQGDIYKKAYTGLYCTPCESFWTESQLVEGNCPDCGRPVQPMEEEAYFLRLSKYQDWLLELYDKQPDFLLPEKRRNEMINNFLKPGLTDLCVTRSTFTWGVPIPFDDKHIAYVWIDALSNYLSVLGYGSDDDTLYRKFWPADVHLVGKEIVRFHAIVWPILLKMLDLPLPEHVFGHGWWDLGDGQKMSKSKGNVIDPVVLVERFGVDAVRYFLLRETPFGADGSFSNEGLVMRLNADLANDIGNLVSRTVAMIEKYFHGQVPACGALTELDQELQTLALELPGRVEAHMQGYQFSLALADIWKLIARANKYIDETAPWILAKDEANKERLGTVLYHLTESIRFVAALIQPVFMETPGKICAQLGFVPEQLDWNTLGYFDGTKAGTKVCKGEALFPRMDVAAELEALRALLPGGSGETAPVANQAEAVKPAAKKSDESIPGVVTIGIDDFAKVRLMVAQVTAAEKVEKSDKLLKLQLDDGAAGRVVVSGIALHYTPESIIGRKVVLVANLAPAKLRGIVSQGMILCASVPDGDGEKLALVTVPEDMPNGAEVR